MTFKSSIPAFPVLSLEKSIAFYTETLGYTCPYQDDSVAILSKDKTELQLWRCGDESWKKGRAGNPVVSGAESFLKGTASCRICVDDVGPLYELCLVADIVHPNGKRAEKPWATDEFAVLDPDGNLITFYTTLPGSKG